MTINKQLLIGAVVRGWCHEKNSHKEMDADLVNAIVNELECAIATTPEPLGKLVDLGITEELLIDQIHAQARTISNLLDRAVAAESKLNAIKQQEKEPLTVSEDSCTIKLEPHEELCEWLDVFFRTFGKEASDALYREIEVLCEQAVANAFRPIEDNTMYDLIKSVEDLEAEVHAAEEESDRAMQEYDRSTEFRDNLRDALTEARNQLRHYKNRN